MTEPTSLNDAPVRPPEPVDTWAGRGRFVHHLSSQNNIYFAGQPDDQAFRDAPLYNITTIISTRVPAEITPDRLGFDEPALIESLNLRLFVIPFTGETLAATDADLLADALASTPAEESAMIHCGSSNRVGALWALYLARHRAMPIDDAIAQGYAAGLSSAALEQRVRALAR